MKKRKMKEEKKKPAKSPRLKVGEDLVLREEGQDALLFDPNTGSIRVLNQTGKFIFKMLDGTKTKGEILAKLCTKFSDTASKQVKKDLDLFLKDLERFGYLGKEIKV